MKTTAFIPARGQSKGLPRKNLKLLIDAPLIAYAIRAAGNAESVDEVVVSTEDSEIASIAASYGAKIHHRAPHYASDKITSETVIAEWIAPIKKQERPDVIVFLQCTAPLMLSADIEGCLKIIRETSCDACCAAGPFHGILWDRDNLPHGMRLPRQERLYKWLEAGSVYVVTLKRSRLVTADLEPIAAYGRFRLNVAWRSIR